jgi:hypothetical protein
MVFARIKRAVKNNTPAELVAKSRVVANAKLKTAFANIKHAFTVAPVDFLASKIAHPLRVQLLRRNHLNEVGRFVHLHDLTPITPEQWAEARDVGVKISSLRDRRAKTIEAEALDPAVALPGGQWNQDGSIPVFPLFEIVQKADYQTINNLRLFSYMFSGFYLAHLAAAQGTSGLSPPVIDDALFARLDLRAKEPPPFTVLEYCSMIRCIPPELHVNLPKMLGEIGWEVGGNIVNTDTRNSQTRLNVFYETGVVDWLRRRLGDNGFLTILEIGSGIGEVSYSLSRVLSPCRFVLCDLPESLLFAATYLRLVAPDAKHVVVGVDRDTLPEDPPDGVEFVYVPNYLFKRLSGVKVDFAFNFGSFEEMSALQVRDYGAGIAAMVGTDGLLLDTNEVYGCNCKQVLVQCFPFRESQLTKTVILKNNTVDLWGNKPIQEIIPPDSLPLKDFGYRWFWRLRQRLITAGILRPLVFAD